MSFCVAWAELDRGPLGFGTGIQAFVIKILGLGYDIYLGEGSAACMCSNWQMPMSAQDLTQYRCRPQSTLHLIFRLEFHNGEMFHFIVPSFVEGSKVQFILEP